MFITILLAGILLMHFIVITWTCLNINGLRYNAIAKLLPVLLSIIFVAGMYFTRVHGNGIADILTKILYIWLGALFLWFIMVMAVMSLQLLLAVFKTQIPFKPGLPIFAAVVLLTIISVINAARAPLIKVIDLTSPKISRTIKIAQISDTHLGDGVSVKQLQKLFAALAEHKPDIIVFTGDIFERSAARQMQAYADVINNFPAPEGKYGSLGNHEYYGGVAKNLHLWRLSGIEPLQNISAQLDGINLIGINDIRAGRVSRAEFVDIIKKSDTAKYTVALSHSPLYFKEAADNGVDLLLSGHTHNGQLWPFNLFVRIQFKHVYGMYKHGSLLHYITSGAFYWGPPMRFLTHNEVPLFIIKPQ